jgi:hypothetical protein
MNLKKFWKKIARRTTRRFGFDIVSWSPTQETDRFPAKFTAKAIQKEIRRAIENAPDRSPILLVDKHSHDPDLEKLCPVVVCGPASLHQLDEFDFGKSLFIYACDSDELGLPFISKIAKKGGKYVPVQDSTPSTYCNLNETARKVVTAEFERQTQESFDKFDHGFGDFLNIIQAIDSTSLLTGDYLEIGCYRGSSACVAVKYMAEIGLARNCYFLDVFDGFNYADAKSSSDTMWLDSHATEGIDVVEKRILERTHSTAGPTVSVVRSNIIEDELPSSMSDIVVANIDVDLYEAIFASLEKVAPRIVRGGIIIVEDPGHTPMLIGARLALEEFMQTEEADHFVSIYMESGQTLLIRSDDSSRARSTT